MQDQAKCAFMLMNNLAEHMTRPNDSGNLRLQIRCDTWWLGAVRVIFDTSPLLLAEDGIK